MEVNNDLSNCNYSWIYVNKAQPKSLIDRLTHFPYFYYGFIIFFFFFFFSLVSLWGFRVLRSSTEKNRFRNTLFPYFCEFVGLFHSVLPQCSFFLALHSVCAKRFSFVRLLQYILLLACKPFLLSLGNCSPVP